MITTLRLTAPRLYAAYPWRKPRTVHEVFATTDAGEDLLAARFTSRAKAERFVRNALTEQVYFRCAPDPRHDRPEDPVFGWGHPKSMITFRVDHSL